MRDFNAKVGVKEDEDKIESGKFGSGDRNDRGEMLIT